MADLYDRAAVFFRDLQAEICGALEEVDGRERFASDEWQREGGGGGLSRVLVGGGLFEKAGVNWSSVDGELPEDFAGQLPSAGRDFRATGVSLVLHPKSPMLWAGSPQETGPVPERNSVWYAHGPK
jgi:coproporphyrinogen III oxidase